MQTRPPLPPFTEKTPGKKCGWPKMAGNTRNAPQVALAFTLETRGGTASASSKPEKSPGFPGRKRTGSSPPP